MNCILNVTDREYDKILQLNHDAVVWSNTDGHLLQGIESLIGGEVVAEIKRYGECRMKKHDDLSALPRVAPAPDLV